MINRVSLAYCTIGKSEVCYRGMGRFRTPNCLALFKMDCNKSTASTNRSGDSGSPFLIEEVPEFRISLIQLIHLSPNPLAFRISKIASCSIVSNAFSKSTLRMFSFFFDLWQICKYSNAHAR
jgi:hypothetical protein